MHFKMSSAICLNLDQSKILFSGNVLIPVLLNSWVFFPGFRQGMDQSTLSSHTSFSHARNVAVYVTTAA